MSNNKTHLDTLEAEAIQILREAQAQFERPSLLFSGGKDSIVLAHLAAKAFWPAPVPFTFVHVDTGHNFPETLSYRDALVKKLGARLVVGLVQDSIDQGTATEQTGPGASRNSLQSVTLLETIAQYQFDACLGGARRDEEKARAKERVFSVRNRFGQWEPRLQRPELWDIYNGKILKGENVRIFPISNWTELDVWEYLKRENIELPSLYFAHERKVRIRKGTVFADHPVLGEESGDEVRTALVRFRTIGDITCTAAVLSDAKEMDDVIAEIRAAKASERGSRIDDQQSEAAMEDRKKNGYF